ncbi:MAG: hypothetical protein ACP5N2_05535 [Candidatus Nanoarchaeia archaeon]
MIDKEYLKNGTPILGRNMQGIYTSAVIQTLRSISADENLLEYIMATTTDKRDLAKGHDGFGILIYSPNLFSIPVEALEGKMTKHDVQQYLERSPDYSQETLHARLSKTKIIPKEVLIASIIDQLEDIVTNYISIKQQQNLTP